jgi:hypothetical protein
VTKVRQTLLLFGLLLATAIAGLAKEECLILTAADVKNVTGTEVQQVARGSKPGAGGRCANFATTDGKLYLGVSQLSSVSEYQTAIAAVPVDIYPKREKLSGVGDEGILMKDDRGTMRYLVARKGNRGVVLFPLSRGPSDEQLKNLANLALSR